MTPLFFFGLLAMMRHEGHGGQWIKDVVADAIALAKLHNCKVLGAL